MPSSPPTGVDVVGSLLIAVCIAALIFVGGVFAGFSMERKADRVTRESLCPISAVKQSHGSPIRG